MLRSSFLLLGFAALVTGHALAADKKAKDDVSCDFVLTGNDQMKFGLLVNGKEEADLKELKIPSACLSRKITITLKHVGTLPKAAMGHNVVLTLASKQPEILNKFMMAGPAKDYSDPSVKEGLIAQTNLIGGGETSKPISLAPNTLKKDQAYSYFCSFPGHAGLMNGKIVFVDSATKS